MDHTEGTCSLASDTSQFKDGDPSPRTAGLREKRAVPVLSSWGHHQGKSLSPRVARDQGLNPREQLERVSWDPVQAAEVGVSPSLPAFQDHLSEGPRALLASVGGHGINPIFKITNSAPFLSLPALQSARPSSI